MSVNPTMMTPEPPGQGYLGDLVTGRHHNRRRSQYQARNLVSVAEVLLLRVPACHAFRSDAATESVSSASERCTPLMNTPGSGRAALSATTVTLNWPALGEGADSQSWPQTYSSGFAACPPGKVQAATGMQTPASTVTASSARL